MSLPTIVLVILAILVAAVIAYYNRLVRGRTRVSEAWADIDIQLKRRADLIPNLLETVKGYKGYEQQTLLAVTEARNRSLQAKTLAERGAAEAAVSAGLMSLFAVAEQYPDLKASTNFLDLQRELTDTEDKIQAARRFYNGLVRDYNIGLATFPGNLIAGAFSFRPSEFFDLPADANREPVKVSFS